ELRGRVADEGIEHPGRVAAAAYAGDDQVGKSAEFFERLLPGLAADDGLEVADDAREGVRADDGADDVVGGFDARHPVAEVVVEGGAERFGATADGADLGTEQLHAIHVRRLAANILIAHVNDTVEAEMGASRGSGDAVLAGTGFGDDAFFSHAEGE